MATSAPPTNPEIAAHPQTKRVRILLGITLFALVLHLIFGDNPWQDGIAKAVRRGRPIQPQDIADTWLWWMAAANTVLAGLLLATVPVWLRPVEVTKVTSLAPQPRGRLFTLFVVAAIGAAAFFLQPRLSFSWWDDELYTLTRHIDGRWRDLGTDEPTFHGVKWEDTFWKNNEANNHIAFTALSRLSLGAWRLVSSPDTLHASEAAVRFPSFVAALAAVAVVGVLGLRLGTAATGIAAAWLLVLHPWFIRYGAEARGYVMVLLLVPASWLLLLNALHRGTWGRWLAYGAAQTLLLCTHMGAVMVLVVTNAAAAVGLVVFHRKTPALREQGARFLVTNLLSAGVWAQLMVPNFVQMLEYLEDWRGRFGVPPVKEVLWHLVVGVQTKTRDPRHVTVERIAEAWPILLQVLTFVWALAFVLGMGRMLASGAKGRLILPAILLPAPIVYVMAMIREDRFYEAYLGFALPGLLILVALGLTAGLRRLRAPLGPQLTTAVLLVALAAFAVLTHEPRETLRASSFVSSRESVLVTRTSLDPFAAENREILTASFSWPAFYYDPLTRWVDSIEALEALEAEADRRGIPLYVNNGRPHHAIENVPELVAIVEQSGRYETVADLPGFEKRGHRIVYRYRGGAAKP